MKTYTVPAVWLLLLASACTDDSLQSAADREALVLCPSVTAGCPTRGAVTGGVLPDGYTIALSAFLSQASTGHQVGNYFTGEAFRYNGSQWKSAGGLFWPVSGRLDFLALAADETAAGFALSQQTEWNRSNVASGAVLSVPDGSCTDTELLFASAQADRLHSSAIALSFRHSQARLRFHLSAADDTPCTLVSLTVKGLYLGGALCVADPDPIDDGAFLCHWDFRGCSPRDYTLPLSLDRSVGREPLTLELLVPWQPQCDVAITYTIDDGTPAPASRTGLCSLPGNAWWYDGLEYDYHITLSRTKVEMSFNAQVEAWNSVAVESSF